MKTFGISLAARCCAAFCCVLSVCISACSCSLKNEDKAGGDLIKAARQEYCGLDSAKVVMTNENTGEAEQTFTFKYDEKDVLMFSYYGKSENSEYAQYNNGTECFTYDNGEYIHSVRGDDDFVRYTRAVTHPQADEGLLIYEPKYIVSDSSETDDSGIEHITHVYDAEKIGAEVEHGDVTDFCVDYYFDPDGSLLYFVETTTADEDGEEVTYPYKVEITERNSVKDVENTTEPFRDK